MRRKIIGHRSGMSHSFTNDFIVDEFSSAYTSTDGLTVYIVFSVTGIIQPYPTGQTGLSVQVNGVTVSLSGVSASAFDTLACTLVDPVKIGDTVTVSYDPGNLYDSGYPQDLMIGFGPNSVTNNSTVT